MINGATKLLVTVQAIFHVSALNIQNNYNVKIKLPAGKEVVDFPSAPSYVPLPIISPEGADLPEKFVSESHIKKDHVRIITNPRLPEGIKLLILVKGAINHISERHDLRLQYRSNNQTDVRFVVGRSYDSDMNLQLIHENESENDIIIGDFEDTYNNLVLKSLTALKWYKNINIKNRPEYVLLVDDDVVVNLPVLLATINQKSRVDTSDDPFLLCPWKNPRNARVTRRGPWAVSIDKYPGSHWPTYCGGACYMVNWSAASKLYDASTTLQDDVDVPIEDAFVTGILRKRAGLPAYNTRPLCAHHFKKDSVTGQFLEQKNHKQ